MTLSCAVGYLLLVEVDENSIFTEKMTRFLCHCASIAPPASTEDLSQVYQSTRGMNRSIFMIPLCTICDSLIPITGTCNLSEAPENLEPRPPPRTQLATKALRLAGKPRNFSSSRHLISYLSGDNDQQRSLSLHCPHFPS